MTLLQFFFIMAGFGATGYFLFRILDVLQQIYTEIKRR
jgi:hypothetical protein